MSRAEKGELIGVGVGLVLSLVLGLLSLKQSADANLTAALANQRADAANAIASQALDLQRSDFLANASSDAGKVKVTFSMGDYTFNSLPEKSLSVSITNGSPRDMNSVRLTLAPCKEGNTGTACSTGDPAWKSSIGQIAGCTRSVFVIVGKQVADFAPSSLNANLDWTDAAGSPWQYTNSAVAASAQPRSARAVTYTDLPVESENTVLSQQPNQVAMYLHAAVAISDPC